MQLDDVDLDTGWWSIPSQFTKNRREHRVPLSNAAIDILRGNVVNAKGQWVFPSPRDGARPISYAAIYYTVQRVIKISGVAAWTSHDLRRTLATELTRSGVPHHVLKNLLNHVETNVTDAVYVQYQYEKEKRLALDAWARRVRDIVEECESTAKVVPISAGQK
jgi:integrase